LFWGIVIPVGLTILSYKTDVCFKWPTNLIQGTELLTFVFEIA
jgi:hypothetical protein